MSLYVTIVTRHRYPCTAPLLHIILRSISRRIYSASSNGLRAGTTGRNIVNAHKPVNVSVFLSMLLLWDVILEMQSPADTLRSVMHRAPTRCRAVDYTVGIDQGNECC